MANTSDKPQITVRLAPETYQKLRRLCDISHLSQTAHVQLALNEYLPRELARYEPPRGTNPP